MSKEKKRLPIGLENFEQIIKENYYYVDKTGLISELLRNGGMVNLFTRPRRFGKSYAAKMLAAYYSKGADSDSLFQGLEISNTDTYRNYLNKYNREQALKMHYKDTFSLYTLRIKFISILIKVFPL